MAFILPMMAFRCSDDGLDMPEDNKGQKPYISMATQAVKIYDAQYGGTAVIDFEASGATEVVIDADFEVKTELVKGDGDDWQIMLSEAKGMTDGQKYYVTVTAKNEYGEFNKKRAVYKAYITNPFATGTYEVGESGQTFNLPVAGNVKWNATVTAGDEDWYDLSVSSSAIAFTVKTNGTTQPRALVLKVTDEQEKYEYSATFNQVRCGETHDEILLKETNAMLALNKALNLGKDTSKPHTEWGIAEYNSKGYVTNIVLRNKTGYIPEEIGDLKYCWEFLLWDCNLTGTLPERIGEMINLKEFAISCNEGYALAGNLSESTLANIASQLRYICLENHNFTGSVPEWLGDTPNHAVFWICGNRLEGKIPTKVLNHKWWTSPNLTGSVEKTYGEFQLKQQEGYVLYE